MDVEPFIQNLSLFFDMRPGIPHNFDDPFEIGKLTMCNNDNPSSRRWRVHQSNIEHVI